VSTEFATKMAEAVRAVAPTLRQQGFKKQRNVFNRDVEPGMTQVLGFQMGAHQPPGAYEIPGLRENLYGAFTVNLGIYLEEVREARPFVLPKPKFVNASHCHITVRLGWLLPDRADTWWRLDLPREELAALVRELVEETAVPFLEKLKSRDALLEAWYARDPTVREQTRPFVIAVVHAARGETAAAEKMMAAELVQTDHAGARERLRETAERLGLRVRGPA
jgi:hypothetical protein